MLSIASLKREWCSKRQCTTLLLITQTLCFWPVWQWYLARMFDGSDEPWGILSLITICIIILRQRTSFELDRHTLHLSAFLTFIYIATFHYTPPLVNGALAIGSISLLISRIWIGQSFHPAITGLFFLSLPIIASLQFFLGYPLRLVTTSVAASFLQFTTHAVYADGINLLWLGERVIVDAPCSGIKMLWATLYLAFTLATLYRFSTYKTWILYSFSATAVFVANTLRTCGLFCLESNILQGPDWWHSAIGLVCFACLAFSVIHLANSLLGKENELSI